MRTSTGKTPKQIELTERTSEIAQKIAKDYIQMRQQLYTKLSPLEIKQLQEKLKQAKENKYKLFHGQNESSQNFDEINKEYDSQYKNFLQRQPEVENKRQQIIINIAESHQIMEILKVDAPLDSGLVSTYSSESNKDQDKINKIIDKKLQQLEEGYIIEDFDEKFDITRIVDQYLEDEEKKQRILLEKERREKDLLFGDKSKTPKDA